MKRIESNSYLYPDRVGDLECKDPTLTQQHFAAEVDVNNIVERALKTGLLGDPMAIAQRQAIFGDFSGIGSYHDALNKVLAAQKAFLELPASTRAKFDNDPANLIAFLSDPKNDPEALKLGLIVKKEDVKAPVVNTGAGSAPTTT